MSLKRTEGMSLAQALAMTVAEIPVFLYSTFGQVKVIGKVLKPLVLCSYFGVLPLLLHCTDDPLSILSN